MKFTECRLAGAYIFYPEKLEDERGYFARFFCEKGFAAIGIEFKCVQISLSHNKKNGTLRGMHMQAEPYAEAKIVQCVKGEIFDAIVDLRKDSPTYMSWESFILSCDNRNALYIPKGFAHGFQTLADDSDVLYFMDEFYHHEAACTFNYLDKSIGIYWPDCDNRTISQKDLEATDLCEMLS